MQTWFAGIITQALTEDESLPSIAPSGTPIAFEAPTYVTPSATLEPYERMQIYSKCYWMRLWDVLGDVFPLVLRLFGPYDFHHTLATPYLATYGSTHWDLNRLGSQFCAWLEATYTAPDAPLVLASAKIDWACQESFFAPCLPPLRVDHLSLDAQEALLSQPLTLQPHIRLFCLPMQLIDFRDVLLRESPEYWLEHAFPKISKGKHHYFAVHRAPNLRVHVKELLATEFTLLSSLQKGGSLEQACMAIESTPELCLEAEQHLPAWVASWITREWLALSSVHSPDA